MWNDSVYTESGIYTYNGIYEFSQLGQDIYGEYSYDYSGRSVSLSADGNRVAIGAYQNDGFSNNSGHVRIYENNNGLYFSSEMSTGSGSMIAVVSAAIFGIVAIGRNILVPIILPENN